jgi:hypothetical protein
MRLFLSCLEWDSTAYVYPDHPRFLPPTITITSAGGTRTTCMQLLMHISCIVPQLVSQNMGEISHLEAPHP